MISLDSEANDFGIISALKSDLAKTQQQFHTIINASQNGILAIDSKGIVIIANRVVAEMLDLELGRIIGQPIVELIPNTLMPEILKTREPLLGQKVTLNNTVIMANYAPIVSDGTL